MADRIAVVFDLDGTLIDSAPEIHATALRVLSDKGLAPIDFATLRSFIGNGVNTLLERILAAQGAPINGPLQQEMYQSFVKIYEESFDLTTLYPGVQEMLATLAYHHHPMAICTNKPEGPTRAVLRHFGLLQHFPVIVGGDTLPQRKPDPAPLRHCVARLNGPGVVFVGDSEVDAQTAQAATVPFALFSGGYRKTPVDLLGARMIFDRHEDLPVLLRGLPQI